MCLSIEQKSEPEKKISTFKLDHRSVEILKICTSAQKRKDILSKISLTNQTVNFNNNILPLLQMHYLDLTIPDKPKSKNQKYITIKEGKEGDNRTIFRKQIFK